MSVRLTNIYNIAAHLGEILLQRPNLSGSSHIWQLHFLRKWNRTLSLGLNASMLRSVRLREKLSVVFRPEWGSEEASLWSDMSVAASLSSSSLWMKEEMSLDVDYSPVTESAWKAFSNLKSFAFSAPLLGGVCAAGWWARSQHPGSSLILPRLMFHLFQLTSSTLRRQEDTCSNYCLLCDASISCQRRQISEEHSVLRINRCCSHSCIFA